MPRKPTPSILDVEPAAVEEETATVVEVEIPVPQAAVEAAKVVKKTVAKTSDAVEEAAAKVEDVVQDAAVKVEEVIQDAVAEALPIEETEVPGEQDMAGQHRLPIPSPLYKPLHTMLLASLGVVSYAVEESKFVVQKLVERGELTEKEGMKLLNEVAKRARRKPKAEDSAENIEAEADQAVKTEIVEIVSEEAEELDEPEEEEEGDASKVRPKNVFTINLFSPGSTVNLNPAKKPKK